MARKIVQKSLNVLAITGLLFTPVCVNTLMIAQSPQQRETRSQLASQLTQKPIQASREKILTKDELYFGLSKPSGNMISEDEWQLFLRGVITPRFQDGLTVMDAYGQYLNGSGTLTREKTKLIVLIYENSPTKKSQIEEIVSRYKQTFQQESVLRVTSTVRVSF
ncbi:DUF3574 domain-containing protein [Iningainema tapete]|uniref:DUF3574 domain-containing protein n=1 Tax=Iningainema tapete BLCC-T55 TaxID=2748662 RepID=A0A8J6Y0I5_9CYAN|nr:DUF3574 domain-containing protein [Iningainema tapete]MBD2776848.1 DUF3574 domain-containing protein [Iningainema tapete BLCC-T55]